MDFLPPPLVLLFGGMLRDWRVAFGKLLKVAMEVSSGRETLVMPTGVGGEAWC